MFNIGDLIIYSVHGICHIDDICEKTYSGITRNYYILHPIDDCKLKISTPVDNNKVTMLELIDKYEAEEILESFKLPGVSWVEIGSQRSEIYYEIVKKGNRKEISKVLNALLRKKHKTEVNGKKLHEQDNKLLKFIENILFTELAMSSNTDYEAIHEKVTSLISEDD
ncbi:CarD family transcriptional regulator [Candidatus Clostridium radicumherbarum]|uniref:CarD family transcriptional regulator n=1 Tax=Candidatus Clostridium radicumherbarum TaxID=3381662 RepID=A0ABW8TSY4_9CLOT